MLTAWKKSYDQPRQHIENQRHCFSNKGSSSQGYGFSIHVWILEMYYKESWAPKNRWFWTVVLEKTLESPLVSKEIQPVHPKGNQPWIYIGRADAEAEAPVLQPPDAKSSSSKRAHLLKRPWCWERLKAGGEGDDRGWDGWMASPTWWTWVWLDSRCLTKLQVLRGTGMPGMLCFMGSQRFGHDWATELNWTELNSFFFFFLAKWKIQCHIPFYL